MGGFVRTSTAKANGYRCPVCRDKTTRDRLGLGYVRHVSNPSCNFEKGERDEFVPQNSEDSPHNRDDGTPPLPRSPSLPRPKEGWLHTVKLVLEIIAITLTVIGGIIALIWGIKL